MRSLRCALQDKAEELKRQQAEAIRRMQQEQMADMQVRATKGSVWESGESEEDRWAVS